MNDKLIQTSLEEESSFSSNIHGIDTITKDINTESIREYTIPYRYNKLQLVLLPVNKAKYYFYWDFPQAFLHENIVSIENISFHIVDENHNLLDDIKCNYEFGQYFYILNKDVKFIKVIAVYKHGIRFKNLLESNTVKIFNTQIKFSDKDIWISKHRGMTEVIRASLNHFTIGMSSKNYVDELRILEESNIISRDELLAASMRSDSDSNSDSWSSEGFALGGLSSFSLSSASLTSSSLTSTSFLSKKSIDKNNAMQSKQEEKISNNEDMTDNENSDSPDLDKIPVLTKASLGGL